jgi:hypothetical protein
MRILGIVALGAALTGCVTNNGGAVPNVKSTAASDHA